MLERAVPEVRNLSFDVGPDVPRHWHGGRRAVTAFFNNLTVFFPPGERFFIASVRAHKDHIRDPKLEAEARAFYAQEGIHSREHIRYNRMLLEQGYPVDAMEARVDRLLRVVTRLTHKRMRLATTAALEHFTAVFAERLLSSEEARAQLAHDEVRSLFCWHALEESEHKAVAFDVYRHVGGSERTRRLVMNIITGTFVAGVTVSVAVGVALDKRARRDVRGALRHLASSPFLTKDMWTQLREYVRPGFHPDDRDTTELVVRWRDELFGPDGKLRDKVA
jgi:uncharacterized protein